MSPPGSGDPIDFDLSEITYGQFDLFIKLCSFLDNPGPDGTSFPKIAKALGVPGPSDGAVGAVVRRFIGEIEATSTTRAPIFTKDNGTLTGLTDLGRRLRRLCEKILDVRPDTDSDKVLRVSIAEAVATYLIPDILLERSIRSAPELDTDQFNLRMERSDLEYLEAGGELARGEIDGAVVWDPKLRDKIVHPVPGVKQTEIKGSNVPVCLVFHASHPLAGLLTVDPKTPGQRPSEEDKERVRADEDGLVVPPHWKTINDYRAALKDQTLHYPGQLNALKPLAARLIDTTHCFRTEGFPAVIAQVRNGLAVGIFPVWPSVLRRLKVEDHIYHIRMPAEVTDRVGLVAFHRDEDNSRTDQLKDLIEEIEVTFERGVGSDPDTMWRPVGWHDPFNTANPADFQGQWSVYYINRGYRGLPYPKWQTGTWEFNLAEPMSLPAAGGGRRVTGQYTSVKFLDGQPDVIRFSLVGTLTDTSLDIVSTPEPGQNLENRPPATLTFLQVVRRGDDKVVFGFIHTAREETTTVAPFLLCPYAFPIELQDLRAICGLVEFHTRATKLPAARHLR